MRVYKFLPKRWALESLRTKRLKIGRADAFNDPFELFPYAATTRVTFLALSMTLREISSDKGFVCFSRSWSNPVIWSHYADQHRGLCLGFDVPDEFCKVVTYVAERLPFPDLETMPYAERLAAADALLYTKFSDWAYEQEIRTAIKLDPMTKEDGMYFLEFGEHLKVAEAIIGMRSATCLREIRDLTSQTPHLNVTRAMASRERFSVTEDPQPVRNHDDLVWHIRRGNIIHPVQFVTD